MAQLPIADFLTARLTEADPAFELRSGTGFESMFFKPMEFIVQPLRDEANDVFTAQSFLRILLTDDPDTFSEDSVDALASNIFVLRREGAQSSGTARVLYNLPVDREYPAGGAVFTGTNSKTYSNPSPFLITAAEMSIQLDDGLYYYDIPILSDDLGLDTELPVDGIVSLANDNDVVRATNVVAIKGGLDRELNTALIDRAQNSIGVRDLVAGKGFRAILFENFSGFLSEVQPTGFGDLEMMRDIVYNVHIGGKVDGYVKTSSITQGSKDFVGLLIDPTRQTKTSANIQLPGTSWSNVGNPNIDRSNDRAPVVMQIKIATHALYISPVDMTAPIDLSVNQHVQLGIDGVFKTVRVAGINPGATSRNEIINIINAAFGLSIAAISGNSLKLTAPSSGLTSTVVITNPTVGNSAILEVFGLFVGTAPHSFFGDGPITFVEGTDYDVDDPLGNFRRVEGPLILPSLVTGNSTTGDENFSDATLNVFLNVQMNDILMIESGPDAGNYRIIEKLSNNIVVLDVELTDTSGAVAYHITRSGIKSNELVNILYYYNPLSIDIGKNIVLDDLGRVLGIRPGREELAITDLAFVRINSIEEIDPLTKEPTGVVLEGRGGWGRGGWGRGGWGVGQGSDFRLVVNKPSLRFSMLEDSYIVLNSSFEGLSFRVNYDYVPEIESMHDFVRSENERTLDGDTLIKHFLPAYVNGTIKYGVDATDATVPSNDALTASLKNFITTLKSGTPIDYSDITQFITRATDPFYRYGTFVEPFQLKAVVHNTDGSTTSVTGASQLVVPTLNPFPRDTPRPLSPKIAHWVADNIVLERL
jgi:hypothetical protein